MTHSPKKILFIVDLKVVGVYNQLLEQLSPHFDISIVVLESFKTTYFNEEKEKFNQLNMKFYLYRDLFEKVYPVRLKSTNSFTHYFAELTTTLKYKYSYSLALAFLKNEKFDLVLHTQDISLSNIGVLKAAYDLNIPSIIPSAIMMEPEDFFHKDNLQYHLHDNSTLYEKYVFGKSYGKYSKHNGLFFYAAPVLNFLKKYNLLSKTPWLYGGSHLTKYLCVSNKYHKDVSVKHGIDANKIKIIGDINYDRLYSNYEKYIEYKDNIIVLAVPQFFEHNYFSKSESKEKINYLVSTASNIEGYELLLSLHPSMKKEDYSYLEDKFNCKISDRPLYEILPSSKLFICVQSNTILWSTLCHVNTIVADFYGWDYKTSDALTSCQVIKEKEKFNTETINKMLLKKVDFNHDDTLLSRSSVFRGKVGESYIQLIAETSTTDRVNKPKKYLMAAIISVYYKYKKYQKNRKILNLRKTIANYDTFYISPYNDLSQELNSLINSDTFGGYIDKNKRNSDIKSIEEVDKDNSCVLIISPNYAKEIYQSIKIKVKNAYIVNY